MLAKCLVGTLTLSWNPLWVCFACSFCCRWYPRMRVSCEVKIFDFQGKFHRLIWVNSFMCSRNFKWQYLRNQNNTVKGGCSLKNTDEYLGVFIQHMLVKSLINISFLAWFRGQVDRWSAIVNNTLFLEPFDRWVWSWQPIWNPTREENGTMDMNMWKSGGMCFEIWLCMLRSKIKWSGWYKISLRWRMDRHRWYDSWRQTRQFSG